MFIIIHEWKGFSPAAVMPATFDTEAKAREAIRWHMVGSDPLVHSYSVALVPETLTVIRMYPLEQPRLGLAGSELI